METAASFEARFAPWSYPADLARIRNERRPSVTDFRRVTFHLYEKSAFRPYGSDLVEFFKSTGWAFLVKLACRAVTGCWPTSRQ